MWVGINKPLGAGFQEDDVQFFILQYYFLNKLFATTNFLDMSKERKYIHYKLVYF